MEKRVSIISNFAIAGLLLVLGLAVFTTDLNRVFVTVSAPISSGNQNKASVSFMINVSNSSSNKDDEKGLSGGNTTENIIAIKEILQDRGMHATFFVNGAWAMGNVNLVQSLNAAGHELGNKAFTTNNFRRLSTERQKKEIQGTHMAVSQISGINMNLFLPPNGNFDRNTLRAAESLNYTTVIWSRNATANVSDTHSCVETIKTLATQNLKNGDLILLNPDSCTIEALPAIIDFYLSQGFDIVTVSQNIGR